ncbi:hypothetical protein J6590_018804 [Homalodisca vitripennis]|nr:hypothetical protein J6590_018804 [Homalodisca vitripennis]
MRLLNWQTHDNSYQAICASQLSRWRYQPRRSQFPNNTARPREDWLVDFVFGSLNLIDGLFYIDDDVVELASKFYSDLKSTSATFGVDSIEMLIPRVSLLFSKLNNSCKVNKELNQDLSVLREQLENIENKFSGLNNSFKEKAEEYNEQEDEASEKISRLTQQLNEIREENMQMKASHRETEKMDIERLKLEHEEKVTVLHAERRCLLTTIEVLEADLEILRLEVRSMSAREKQGQAAADIYTELHHCRGITHLAADVYPRPCHSSDSAGGNFGGDLKKVLLIGDSHLRYASRSCVERGAIVDCCPGARTENVKSRLLNYVNLDLSVVYIHVGCNNLRRGYRGGPGYNGGHGKREALHSMADLLYTARTPFQNSKIVLNSILILRDIGNRALRDFNYQLDLMCNNFGVEFVEVNNCVCRRDLARDGTHLNCGGASRLGSLMLDVVSQYLAQLAPTFPPQKATSVAPTPETGESSGTGAVGGCPDDFGRPGVVDTSRLSGNLHVRGEAVNSESHL